MEYKISGLFFGSILLFVIISSGCVDYKDGTLSIKFQNITEKMPDIKIPEIKSDIDVRINEVKYSECRISAMVGEKRMTPCIIINMNIKNNRKEAVALVIPDTVFVVTKNGKQIESFFSGAGYALTLYPNSQVNFTRDLPIIPKNDNPVLYIPLIKYFKDSAEQKDYNFDLTPYLNN